MGREHPVVAILASPVLAFLAEAIVFSWVVEPLHMGYKESLRTHSAPSVAGVVGRYYTRDSQNAVIELRADQTYKLSGFPSDFERIPLTGRWDLAEEGGHWAVRLGNASFSLRNQRAPFEIEMFITDPDGYEGIFRRR